MSGQPSNQIDLPRLIDCADCVINVASKMVEAEKKEKRGGYLVVLEVASGSIELILRLNYFNSAKAPKYIEFAMEKASRLYLCIKGTEEGDERSLTSYATRNPANDKWGGAIYGKELIFSFSGLPELYDEAAMFVVAIHLGELEESVVLDRIDAERNPHLRPLLELTRSWKFD